MRCTCAMHVLYMCCTCAMHVLYMCYACAVHVLCMCCTSVLYVCCACAVHVLCMCCTCAVYVLCMCMCCVWSSEVVVSQKGLTLKLWVWLTEFFMNFLSYYITLFCIITCDPYLDQVPNGAEVNCKQVDMWQGQQFRTALYTKQCDVQWDSKCNTF